MNKLVIIPETVKFSTSLENWMGYLIMIHFANLNGCAVFSRSTNSVKGVHGPVLG